MRDIRSIKHDNLNQYYQMLDNYSSWSRDALKTEINRLRRELRTASFDQYTKEKFLLMIEAAEEILYNKKENKMKDSKILEIKKDVKIGNVILEKGDKIRILNLCEEVGEALDLEATDKYKFNIYDFRRYEFVPIYSNEIEKWGYAVKDDRNRQINLTIPFMYDEALHFEEIGRKKLAIVTLKNKDGVIDSKNKVIVPFKYDKIEDFRETGNMIVSRVKIGNKYGLIDSNGKIIIPVKYEYLDDTLKIISDYPKPIIKFDKNGKTGVMDIDEKVILSPVYDILNINRDGFFDVQVNNSFFFVDVEGNLYDEYKNNLNKTIDDYLTNYSQDDKFKDVKDYISQLIKTYSHPEDMQAFMDDGLEDVVMYDLKKNPQLLKDAERVFGTNDFNKIALSIYNRVVE